MDKLIKIGIVFFTIMMLSACAKTVQYYDPNSEKCDSTMYDCIDIRKI